MPSHACCRWSCLSGGCLDQRFVEPRPSSRRLAVCSRNSPLGRKPSRSKCIFFVDEIIMPSLSVGISVACRLKQLQNTPFLIAFRHSRRSRTRFLLNYNWRCLKSCSQWIQVSQISLQGKTSSTCAHAHLLLSSF